MSKNYFALQFLYINNTVQLMLRTEEQLALSEKKFSRDTTPYGHYKRLRFDTFFDDKHDFIDVYPLDSDELPFLPDDEFNEVEHINDSFNAHLLVKLPDHLTERKSIAVIQLVAAQLGADMWKRLGDGSTFTENRYINLITDLELLTKSKILDE